MLDPRIYRTGFVAVALAVIVFAFSLTDQQGGLSPTLAPDAFSGQNAFNLMNELAVTYPDRRPGSYGDDALAADMARRLHRIQGGYAVNTSVFKARTIDGIRTLETVTAVRAGENQGSIVVLAHRDARTAPAAAELSASSTLLELGRVLAGETQHHTIVLASTSGSAGDAGAVKLARSLTGPVDAVVALGDLAGTRAHQPVVVPWSDGQQLAPAMLRKTVAGALGSQAALRSAGPSLAGQLAHLAFPFTLSEQGPFGARGIPAVLVSLAGDAPPPGDEPTSQDQITSLGRSVLQTINALDNGPAVPKASPYLVFQDKVIPAWAVKLLVLAFILPVLLATIDGLARARRRAHSITRAVIWVLASAVPFALAVLAAVAFRLTGLIDAVPPEPVPGGAVPMHASGALLLLALAAVIALSFFAVRPLVLWLGRARRVLPAPAAASDSQGAAAGVLLVMCVAAIVIWVGNPFAAAFVVPALHLWMWIVDPAVRMPRVATAALLLGGLAAPVLLLLYYAHAMSLGPVQLLWNGLLLVAGGHVTLAVALEYCVLMGCLVSLLLIVRRELQVPAADQAPVTVRGPVTYAGPGSLGGTESAIRR
jgi:hypothetical protein